MKSSKTAGGLALVGILCAGLAMMPGKGWATECEAYASAAATDDSYEPNNTAAAATVLINDTWLGAGGNNCGVMFVDDEDWYKIDVPAGNTGINIDLRFEYDLGDMDLWLFDTDGASFLASSTSEYDNESIDRKTALAAGTYYIKVNSSNPGKNRYRLSASAYMPVAQHTVTSSVSDINGSVNPSGGTLVDHNGTLNLTLAPSTGYTASRNVVGTCPYGNWTDGTSYTTGAIDKDCTAEFSFGATKVVTSSAGAGGSVEPSGAQDVAENDTRSFTVTPATGFSFNPVVGGSCPTEDGIWNDDVYTTAPITTDCTVEFSFIGGAATWTVTSSANPVAGGTVTPNNGLSTVNAGATKEFTVTANPGYTTNTLVTGTCVKDKGYWTGNVYTTDPITADCTVDFTFTSGAVTHTVTPSAGTGGSFTPTGAQTVNHNTTKAFTVTANSGYTTNSAVTGTCPQGTWAGNVYTTGAISADCTVIFGFTSNGGSTNAPSLQGVYRMLL